MSPAGDSKSQIALGRCPICGKSAVQAYRPFCSRRCSDIDLARWLGGGYVVAGGAADADEDGEEDRVREGRDLPPNEADEEET